MATPGFARRQKTPDKTPSTGASPKTPKLKFNNAISLPKKVNVPPSCLTDYSWCIYGEKGIGKSTLAALFPDVSTYFMWETARRGLKIPMIPDLTRREAPLDWSRFKDYLSLLYEKQDPGRIVIDTIDLCALAWEKYWAAQKGVSSLLSIRDHGRTWATCMDDWENTMNSMLWAGWRFTFVSHTRKRPRSIRGVTREEIQQLSEEGVISSETQPSARPWVVHWMKANVAYAAYYGWWGDERMLQIRGSGNIYASCENSEDHFINPPKSEEPNSPYYMIPMGTSPRVSFENLSLAWDNKLEGFGCEVSDYDDAETEQ